MFIAFLVSFHLVVLAYFPVDTAPYLIISIPIYSLDDTVQPGMISSYKCSNNIT